MRGEGAGRPGLNCCASYWPISLLKAEAFGRSKSRSPVAALPLCRRLTCAARARALCAPRKWVRRKVESFMTPCSPVHAGGFFFTYYFLCNFRNVQGTHLGDRATDQSFALSKGCDGQTVDRKTSAPLVMGLPGDLSTTAPVAGSSWHRHVRMPLPEHRFDLVNVPPF